MHKNVHILLLYIWQWNSKFEKGMNLRVLLLNWLQLSHFQRLKANLFHSIIIAGKKKNFWRNFGLCWNMVCCLIFYIHNVCILRKLNHTSNKENAFFLENRQTSILDMFLMKKFLTKLGNYKLRKQHNKMIFQQIFWRKTQRCLLNIFKKT